MPDDLRTYVLRHMPLGARMIGRERLDFLIDHAVQSWPSEELMASRPGTTRSRRALAGAERDVRLAFEKRYGFFWTLVLSALVSAVVQHVFKWWLERHSHREQMETWRKGAAR
jgi:hypothetical protein